MLCLSGGVSGFNLKALPLLQGHVINIINNIISPFQISGHYSVQTW
jgi:hypothetical protein